MNVCPSRESLAGLLSGDSEDETLVDHIGLCEKCQQQLEALSDSDGDWQNWQERLQTMNLSWPTPLPLPDPGNGKSPDIPGYEIEKVLGQGGMGIVYKAHHLALDRPVALKMIRAGWEDNSDLRRYFSREARALAQLRHPHMVQIYDILEHEGRPLLALEYVHGSTLEQRLRLSTLGPSHAARLAELLARAVQAAHDVGVIHRDLKPANILLEGETLRTEQPFSGRGSVASFSPKITDFGLARRMGAHSQSSHRSIMGTPSYMSPEQATGSQEAQRPAVDIYALGAILYESLTGRPPFRAESMVATLLQVAREPVVAPSQLQPNVPRDLETICLKCLEKSPERRYRSCEDLAEDLRRYQAGEPIRARPIPVWHRAWKWCKRHPLVTTLSWLIVVSICALLFLWIRFTADLHELNVKLKRENLLVLKKEREARAAKKMEEIQKRKAQTDLFQMIGALKMYHQWIRDEPRLKKEDLAALQKKLLHHTHRSIERVLTRITVDAHIAAILSEQYRWLSEASWRLGFKMKAKEYIQRAVNIRKVVAPQQISKGVPQGVTARYLMDLASMMAQDGKLDRSIALYKEATTLLEDQLEHALPKEGTLHFWLAQVHFLHAETVRQDPAIKHKARPLFVHAKEAIGEAMRRQSKTAFEDLARMIEKRLQ